MEKFYANARSRVDSDPEIIPRKQSCFYSANTVSALPIDDSRHISTRPDAWPSIPLPAINTSDERVTHI